MEIDKWYHLYGRKDDIVLEEVAQPESEERMGESAQNVPKEDLISRKAVIDAIEPTLKSILQGNSFKAINVMDKIRDLPSAQPERKNGRWIGGEIGHCSCCGHKGCASDIWNDCNDGRFCPNCGADMRGEQDG